MKMIKIKDSIYNLDQLVAAEERVKDPIPWGDEEKDTELVLTFREGIAVKVPESQRDSIMQQIQEHMQPPPVA